MAVMELDTNLVMAALLHDVVEDTNVTAADLAERFAKTLPIWWSK